LKPIRSSTIRTANESKSSTVSLLLSYYFSNPDSFAVSIIISVPS
jgi:hypothetical protein